MAPHPNFAFFTEKAECKTKPWEKKPTQFCSCAQQDSSKLKNAI
jgi:hypothetical protein